MLGFRFHNRQVSREWNRLPEYACHTDRISFFSKTEKRAWVPHVFTMTQDIEKQLAFWVLIILACAFLIIVPVSAETSSTRSAAQFASPFSPITTPQGRTNERPHPVRRFFSWVRKTVSGPFRKRVPPISDPPTVLLRSSTSVITSCPPWLHAVDECSASHEVELSATVGDPELDGKLIYVWAVSAGRLRGAGHKVIWDLSDVAEGTYRADVEVNDGPLAAFASTKVTIARCRICETRESPCPTIMVSCPDNAKANQSTTFQADVSAADPSVKVTYTWSVSAGTISSGQGTSIIKVKVSDVTRGSITATVSVGGLHPACSNTASCTTEIAGRVAKAGCGPF